MENVSKDIKISTNNIWDTVRTIEISIPVHEQVFTMFEIIWDIIENVTYL